MPGRSLGESWLDSEFVEHVAETLDIGPGTQVFEVACGTGDFLLPLFENGYVVGGLDANPDLIAQARTTMPGGRFSAGSPSELDPAQPWNVVICRAFGSFPDRDSARGVLARMAAKATHAIAVLDVPEAVIERSWVLKELAEIGVIAVQMEDMKIEGRFNVYARL